MSQSSSRRAGAGARSASSPRGDGGLPPPLRGGLDKHPRALDDDGTLEDRVLRAFPYATVIPGIDASAPDAIRVFHDPCDPFAKYARSSRATCAAARPAARAAHVSITEPG